MGLAYANIDIFNARNLSLGPVSVRALADAGALHLCIPESVASRLQLETLYELPVTLADGSTFNCPYVGPIQLRFSERRQGFVGALVMGNQVLLGAVPMEDLDLIVDPARQRVIANPSNPDTHGSFATGVTLGAIRRTA